MSIAVDLKYRKMRNNYVGLKKNHNTNIQGNNMQSLKEFRSR